MQNNGNTLCFASEELKNDKEVVLAAVNQDSNALHYASRKFERYDRDIQNALNKEADDLNSLIIDQIMKELNESMELEERKEQLENEKNKSDEKNSGGNKR